MRQSVPSVSINDGESRSRPCLGAVHRVLAAVGLVVVLALIASACGSAATSGGASTGSSGTLHVVATENFWGSIAAQLGGGKVTVTSIITNPNTDPHSYEPTAADARTFATGKMVILDGIGYDPWAAQLLAADPVNGRVVLDVGDLVHVAVGGNPHQWYSPASVHAVIAQITADYQRLDPVDSAYFAAQRGAYLRHGLARYDQLIGAIKARYAGTPVGASESIFAELAPALGLRLLTPPSFLRAISEGAEPTAADKQTIDHQIAAHLIKVYVYNSQNATPDVQAQVQAARAAGIPVTTITETLVPATATFQAWQVAELEALRTVLAKATGK
jgi:zinc/manganese transport system substrate-binding protein